MNTFEQYEVWFVTGAQLLYGGDAVIAVDAHSNEMVKGLNDSGKLPVKVVYKGTVNSSKRSNRYLQKPPTTTISVSESSPGCTPSLLPKMWIHGLQELKKPLLHFHTQFNKEIPWETMDMDFYEPEPIGSRRPRVRTHRDTHAKEPQSGSRPLAGRKKPKNRLPHGCA